MALNGDGGDEVFAGYLRLYGGALSERVPRWAFAVAARRLGLLPEPARPQAPAALRQALRRGGPAAPRRADTCAGTSYFPEGLLALLRPELAPHADRAAASSRARGRTPQWRRREHPRAPPPAQLRDLPARRPAGEDGPHDRWPTASRPARRSSTPRSSSSGRRCPIACACALARARSCLRRAMKDVPARVDPGAREDGLRRAARRVVPGRPERHSCASGFSTARARSTSTCGRSPWPTLVSRHSARAADLSPQIWALLTLESWLRQERVSQSAPMCFSGAHLA